MLTTHLVGLAETKQPRLRSPRKTLLLNQNQARVPRQNLHKILPAVARSGHPTLSWGSPPFPLPCHKVNIHALNHVTWHTQQMCVRHMDMLVALTMHHDCLLSVHIIVIKVTVQVSNITLDEHVGLHSDCFSTTKTNPPLM